MSLGCRLLGLEESFLDHAGDHVVDEQMALPDPLGVTGRYCQRRSDPRSSLDTGLTGEANGDHPLR